MIKNDFLLFSQLHYDIKPKITKQKMNIKSCDETCQMSESISR